jgi:pectinesterase
VLRNGSSERQNPCALWLRTTVLITFVALACVARADVLLTVDKAGGGQFTTVQAAINSVPTNPSERYIINIAPGTYTEQISVNKPKVFLKGTGSDPSKTILTFNQTAQPGNVLSNASTAVTSSDFTAQNITFQNTAGDNAGQALAMNIRADRAVFDNCRFLSWQDTLRPEKQRRYFQNCYIEGDVDYIYGAGKAYFENCTMYSKSGGYVTAQGKEGPSDNNGFVFHHATVTGSASNDSVYLGRPWQAYSTSIFLDSTLGDLVNPAGWSVFAGNNNFQTCYFAEYNSTGPGAGGTRVAWSQTLTSNDIAPYSLQNWLGGSDNWNPLAAIPEPSAVALLLAAAGMLCRHRAKTNGQPEKFGVTNAC